MHLIDEEGKSLGVVSHDQALLLAHQRGYDLVEVTSTVYPPICRLLDFGKYTYQLEKNKKKQHRELEIKEVRMKLSIEPHDLEVKKSKVKKFLENGHKTKVTIFLRGREMAFSDRAFKFLSNFSETLGENIVIDKQPERLGNRVSIVLVMK